MVSSALAKARGKPFPRSCRPWDRVFEDAEHDLDDLAAHYGQPYLKVLTRALMAFVADDWARSVGFPLGALMGSLSRWLPDHPSTSTDPDDYDPRTGPPKDSANFPAWNAYCEGTWKPAAQLRIAT